ncbi:MAG: MoaD/ThiS family protein [Acidimicrobiia bacterium]
MPILRLFANLRELAGVSKLEVEGDTIGEMLESASRRFGPGFESGLQSAAIWRNGEQASIDDPVDASDEVALIPPVSGGSETVRGMAVDASALTGVIALLVLIGANIADGQAWWAAALVAVAAGWVIDLGNRLALRRKDIAVNGLLLALVLAAVSTHVLGGVGLGMTLVLGTVAVLGWGVALPAYRSIESIAPAVMVAIISGAAIGSMMLARTVFEPGEHAATIFLAVVVVAGIAGWLLERARSPLVDPFAGTALAAVLAAVLGALVWDEDLIGYLLVGLGMAVLLVGGRSFGSLIRTGRLALSEPAIGIMAALDSALVAAALYYPLVTLAL